MKLTKLITIALVALAGCTQQRKPLPSLSAHCGFWAIGENPDHPGYVMCVTTSGGGTFDLKYDTPITVNGKTCIVPSEEIQ